MPSTINYYEKNAKTFIDGTLYVDFTEIQDMFLELLPDNAYILDFGCGSGRDTKYFLDKGYSVDAIDGSSELCKAATEFTGIDVKHMYFHELIDALIEVYNSFLSDKIDDYNSSMYYENPSYLLECYLEKR